jgi:hypothetical protein
MQTRLEVEPEVALKIQARARERSVSLDAYLLELIEPKTPSPKLKNALIRKSEFACCESGRQVIVPTRYVCLTTQLTAKASTKVVIGFG